MYIKNIDILTKKIQQDYGCSQTCNTGSDLKYALSFHVIDLNYIINIFRFCLLVFWLKLRRLSRKIFGLLFSTAPQGESNYELELERVK